MQRRKGFKTFTETYQFNKGDTLRGIDKAEGLKYACDLKDKNLADLILHYFETILSLQDEEEKFWLRIKQMDQ